jgi:phosphoserine phosphatase
LLKEATILSFPQIRYLGSDACHQAFINQFGGQACLIDAVQHSKGVAACWRITNTEGEVTLDSASVAAWAKPLPMDLFWLDHPVSIKLAVFDMDSTLIQAEVIDELAREAGVLQQVAELTEKAMQGELDFDQSFSARMSLLNGLSLDVLESVYQRLSLMPGAEPLMQQLNALGVKCWIISGGFDYFAERISKRLNMNGFVANRLPHINNQLTGTVLPPIVNADAKREHLDRLMHAEGLTPKNCLAVGDGANDLHMLARAGFGVAYRAKPAVSAQASFNVQQGELDDLLWLLGLST